MQYKTTKLQTILIYTNTHKTVDKHRVQGKRQFSNETNDSFLNGHHLFVCQHN